MTVALTKPAWLAGAAVSPSLMRLGSRVLVIILLGGILAVANGSFLTANNLLNVLRQSSLIFFLASGLTLVVMMGEIDLSIGANLGLSACVAGSVIQASGSPLLGVGAGLCVGTGIGLLNGLVVTALRIPSFIATYGMSWVLGGCTYWFMAGTTIYGFPPGFRALGSGYWLGIPLPVWLMLGVLAAGSLFVKRTIWGQEGFAVGANPVAARLSGIPVRRRLMTGFLLSGALSGVAAVIFLARLNSAEGDIGDALTLPAVTAVLIGGTSLFGGSGSLADTFIGALILTMVVNGMNLLAIAAEWQPLVTGVILVLAVLIDMAGKRGAHAGR